MFEYKKGITTTDDIIEHILMRLNTDFEGTCLTVSDFCYNQDTQSPDYNISLKVMSEMFEHKIAKECTGEGSQDYDIELISKGVQVFQNGGWRQYIKEYNETKAKTEEQESGSKTWSIRSSKATVFGTFFGAICFFWASFESCENKKKDAEIKQLRDSLSVIKTNTQLFLKSIAQDSSQQQYPKQKYDSLKRSKN